MSTNTESAFLINMSVPCILMKSMQTKWQKLAFLIYMFCLDWVLITHTSFK